MLWETPFGHYYGDNRENNGNYFANDISNFYEELIKKCNFRIGEGFYVVNVNIFLYKNWKIIMYNN